MTLSPTAIAEDARCDEIPDAVYSTNAAIHQPPRLDGPTVVDSRFRILALTDIDVRTGRFQFKGYGEFAYCDPRHAFDPIEGESELRSFVGSAVLKKQEEIWGIGISMVNEITDVQVKKRELTI